MRNNFISNIKNDGFHIEKAFFEQSFIEELNKISNNIIKLEKFFNLFGMGNLSKRNGNIFTSNLMFKHKIFIDLITNRKILKIPNLILEHYNLSEYKIISSKKTKNFKYWWHQDYPYNYNDKISNSNIGILIPLMKFDKDVGSTTFIPKSHVLKNQWESFNKENENDNAQFLETNIGDVFIYDGKLIHSGAENKTGSIRNLISIQFVSRHISPSEDMKIQYFEVNKRNEILKEIMTNYLSPTISYFGSNRTWQNTIYWRLLKYFYFFYNRCLLLKLSFIKSIYKIFV